MGLVNWFMHRQMRRDARKIVRKIAKLYLGTKRRLPDATESAIIKNMTFNEDKVNQMSPQMKNMIEVCGTCQ